MVSFPLEPSIKQRGAGKVTQRLLDLARSCARATYTVFLGPFQAWYLSCRLPAVGAAALAVLLLLRILISRYNGLTQRPTY